MHPTRPWAGIAFLLLLLTLAGCEQAPLLDRLQQRGAIRIATVAGPLTCQLGPHGPEGIEYALAGAFARTLELQPEFLVYPTRADALKALARGEVQMVAAARLPTQRDQERFLLSRPWHRTTPIFARTMGSPPIKNLEEPLDEPLILPGDSLQEERLHSAAPSLPLLSLPHHSEESILELVNAGAYHHTLTNQLLLRVWRKLRPHLLSGRVLPPGEGFRWYFPKADGTSLRQAADRFLESEEGKELAQQLIREQVDALPHRNFVTLRDFWRHVAERLPKYERMFRKAGEETGIDWRLLAAIGYQESHWRANAVSPTGVKGIMMLTREAARREKVSNRFDPAQSIAGGARYLLWMEQRIPSRIDGLDRLWLTLASYNIGYGHLEDARVLTQRGGGDPDRWEEVKRFLPLLSKEKYYKTVKHGRARGGEPVIYVENIRYYYRLLVWWDNRRQGLDCTSGDYPLLALKNWRKSSPQGSASTPPVASVK